MEERFLFLFVFFLMARLLLREERKDFGPSIRKRQRKRNPLAQTHVLTQCWANSQRLGTSFFGPHCVCTWVCGPVHAYYTRMRSIFWPTNKFLHFSLSVTSRPDWALALRYACAVSILWKRAIELSSTATRHYVWLSNKEYSLTARILFSFSSSSAALVHNHCAGRTERKKKIPFLDQDQPLRGAQRRELTVHWSCSPGKGESVQRNSEAVLAHV